MIQQRINVEHPDLTKMTDKTLYNECLYWHDYAQKILIELGQSLLSLGRGADLPLPIRKRTMDFYFASDRYEAILNEIQYRKQMMI